VPGEPSLACFVGKVAGLMSASPGALGGLRGLVHVRAILGNIKVLVIPEQVAITKAHEAFEADGRLKDAQQQKTVEQIGAKVASVIARLQG
jgi:NAD(P)H-dependent FMN reductase